MKSHESLGVPNHRQLDSLSNSLFMLATKKTSKLCITDCLYGESTSDLWIPSQRASNSESASVLWRHYVRILKPLTSGSGSCRFWLTKCPCARCCFITGNNDKSRSRATSYCVKSIDSNWAILLCVCQFHTLLSWHICMSQYSMLNRQTSHHILTQILHTVSTWYLAIPSLNVLASSPDQRFYICRWI